MLVYQRVFHEKFTVSTFSMGSFAFMCWFIHPPPTILAQALQGAKVARFAPFTAQEKHPQQCFGIPRPGNLLWDFNKHGDFIIS
jgi:hypothetical protein